MTDSRYVKRTIVRHRLKSRPLKEERGIIVYLPPEYADDKTYPVIYCQDGEQFFNFGRIATQANRLILDNQIIPSIIVGVEVNLNTRSAEYRSNGPRFPAYCAFFAEELVPYIGNLYPDPNDPSKRILAGDSLGGAVSLHLALDHPHLFQHVISLSGAFYEPVRKRIEQEHDLSWLEMFMVVGLQETGVVTDHGTYDFLRMNRQTRELLKQRNAKVAYREKEGTHIWGFWQKELPHALIHFLGNDS